VPHRLCLKINGPEVLAIVFHTVLIALDNQSCQNALSDMVFVSLRKDTVPSVAVLSLFNLQVLAQILGIKCL
jgi:hypothetical protein